MKKILALSSAVLAFICWSFTQVTPRTDAEFEGAWTTSYTDESGDKVNVVAIVQDGYMAQSYYKENPNLFIQTVGGPCAITDNSISLEVHFSSSGNPQVGTKSVSGYTREGNTITMKEGGWIWTRIDQGTKTPLASAWFITGRKRNGELRQNYDLGPRRTMKILSGTRFQWIAYNMETGDFRGTGGGTYSADKGKYTENIEFFSRDNSRVGASLEFDFEVKAEEWHHSGLSSKGNPIYEIWSPIEKVSFSGGE